MAAATVGLLALPTAGPASAAPAGTPRALALSSSVSPPVITAGQTATQTITMSRAAPVGGMDVFVYGDARYNDFTSGRVHLPAGATSVSFPIRVGSYAVPTTVALHAQVSGRSLQRVAEVVVRPPTDQAVAELRFTPRVALANTWTTGVVVLRSPAPQGGVTVDVRRNTSYGPVVIMPLAVTVPAGSTTATFDAWVDSISEAEIIRPSAHLGASAAATELVVLPNRFDLGPGYARRGAVTEAAIGIGAAPNPDGVTIALTTTTEGVTVPPSVFVPPGSPGTTFPVTVSESASVSEPASITATWNGTSVTESLVIG
ncbi:hypothetical protein D7223_17345 [Micromonospora endolithica]|uniref:Uncharacterized protein n=1 Tax=Micromonospora endolithica TaxID=230091 RepID=A0A3A9ZBV4_9ACTN|nr:hypothetical protein D7223_17345 [Micromonospora endolithica]